MKKRTRATSILIIFVFTLVTLMCSSTNAKPPNRNVKSKFYDFSEQLIDGQIRTPSALYINTREKARFERLLRLKKSFMRRLFETSKNPVFK
jgi:hypothetical protein